MMRCLKTHRMRKKEWVDFVLYLVAVLAWSLVLPLGAAPPSRPEDSVRLVRVPEGGLQPRATVDPAGTIHLIYFRGDAGHGDIFYVRSSDDGVTFSDPIRVNSQPGSAVAAGTIRGAQIALGREGRVHVAWNGSSLAEPKGPLNPDMGAGNPNNGLPMLYARLDDSGAAFEPQRNVMQKTHGLDGGGSVAADREGNVYIAWHGSAAGVPGGEAARAVWVARSSDDGATFSMETRAADRETGACGCCGMSLFAQDDGRLYGLYRSATASVHRDIYLLASPDQARSFRLSKLDTWELNACPMSSMSFVASAAGVLAAWETKEQVYFSAVDSVGATGVKSVGAPGEGRRRKHPRLASRVDGDVLLVWTEGTGWQKGGDLAWQVFDRMGNPQGKPGRVAGLPAWSFGEPLATRDGEFVVFY